MLNPFAMDFINNILCIFKGNYYQNIFFSQRFFSAFPILKETNWKKKKMKTSLQYSNSDLE